LQVNKTADIMGEYKSAYIQFYSYYDAEKFYSMFI